MTADVTVFMPVYKAENFVGDAIQSVLAQSYGNFKLVIAVEPAGDGSADVCRKYAHDPRVTVIENETRLGWVGNVNACLDRLDTPFFAFCFHDDALAPGFIEKLSRVLAEQPDTIAAFGAMQKFGAMEGVTPVQSVAGTPASRAIERIKNGFVGYGLKSLQRAQPVLDGLRMPEVGKTGFAADWPFELAYTLRGNFVAIDEVVYHKRFWSESVTSGWQRLDTHTRAADIVAVQAEMLRIVGNAGLQRHDLQHLVHLILDRFVVKYSLNDDPRDLEALNDSRETLAPTLLIADLLSREAMPTMKAAQQRSLEAETAEARFNLARRFQKLGQSEQALHYLRQALRLGPDNVRARLLLSRLLLASGAADEAGEQAQLATEAEPENPRAWMHLANAQAQLGSWSDVFASARLALQFNHPDRERAEALLARAEKEMDA